MPLQPAPALKPLFSGFILREDFEFESPRWYRSLGSRPVYNQQNPVTSADIQTISIFPLDNGVAIPTGVVPLNIFAPQYVQMINDLYAMPGRERLFGLVMSDGKGGLAEIGTGLEIVHRDKKADGRQLLSTVCRQRFIIRKIVQEEPYIIAEVAYGLDDLDIPVSESPLEIPDETSDLEKEVYQTLVDVVSLSNKLDVYGEAVNLPDKIQLLSPKNHMIRKTVASLFSFAVSDYLNISASERQVLLQSPTLHSRLRRLRNLLTQSRDALIAKLGEKGEEGEAFG